MDIRRHYKPRTNGWIGSIWIRFVSHPGHSASTRHQADNSLLRQQNKDSYRIGLINTCYTIGAIISGFFLAGPIVSQLSCFCLVSWTGEFPFHQRTRLPS